MVEPLLSATPSIDTVPAGGGNPEKTAAAAGEFEALLIGSLLKSMRETGGGGWLGGGDDKPSESLLEIAEQQLARMMAAQGGLGLARMVRQGLAQKAAEGGAKRSPKATTAPGR